MILSKNSDVKELVVKSIEGKPMNGDLLVKPLIKGDEMTLLEIHYQPGVGAPLHVHSHESLAYVVKGKVKNTPRLPAIHLGRRIVIRRTTLELWQKASKQGTELDAMMPSSGKSAVDAWKEEFHA